jgi:zinc protease
MRFPSLTALLLASAATGSAAADYAIVVSAKTAADPAWSKVVSALAERRQATVLKWEQSPEEVLPALAAQHPEFTCFPATPEETSKAFVNTLHRMTRRYDSDPWTDTRWGILTGLTADDAMKSVTEKDPLVIRRVGSGTELAMDRIAEGTWYCELRQGHMVSKKAGGEASQGKAPDDTTAALVALMNDGKPDLWVTSGHATERDWMIGFRYENGFWKSKAGRLYGQDTAGRTFDVQSPNPKVYLPIGNCLMGHVDGPDAMALAYMHSAGVRQMIGYVEPTWYGYMGWGLLDYFVEQPGRYSLSEAFTANNIALVHRLQMACPEALAVTTYDSMGQTRIPLKLSAAGREAGLSAMDVNGLLFDRDMVAFYGDPAWDARMAEGKCNYRQELTGSDGTWTLTVTPLAGADSWKPVNQNGSQRGGRPIVAFLPERIDPASIRITEGAALHPVIADDFILVPLPGEAAPAESLRVVFTTTEK